MKEKVLVLAIFFILWIHASLNTLVKPEWVKINEEPSQVPGRWPLPSLLLSYRWDRRLDYTVCLQRWRSSHLSLPYHLISTAKTDYNQCRQLHATLYSYIIQVHKIFQHLKCTKSYPITDGGKSTSLGFCVDFCWDKFLLSNIYSYYFGEVLVQPYYMSHRHATLLFPENMPKLVCHNGNFRLFRNALGYVIVQMCCVFLDLFMTPTLFFLRWSSEAFAMASCERCSSDGHNDNVNCVYVQLCEGWKGKEHARYIGKTILSASVTFVCPQGNGNVVLQENQALWHTNYCTQGAYMTQQPKSN